MTPVAAPLYATPVYAALLAILFLVLSVRVARSRKATRILLGTEGDPELLRRVRVQGNCAEYAPLGLLLILIVELQGCPTWWVHGLGVLLLVGRVVHAWGVSQTDEPALIRGAGMVMTLSSIGLAAVTTLVLWATAGVMAGSTTGPAG